jgi:ribosome-associated protein
MLEITDTIHIPEDELTFTFARAGGPGGQNVNKVSSKVLLRWQPAATSQLPEDVLRRLLAQQRRRLTREGELLITSQRFRDQGKNKEDCLQKLRELVLAALHAPRVRKKSRPTRASHERRLQEKRHRTQAKTRRQRPGRED